MPLNTDLERQWAYYVPQPIPDDAVEHANDSVRDLKILDPAVGSGHFLVAAFDLLHALYQEEARHRGETDQAEKWSDQAIVERILEHNLNGIDLDSRAVQIAAAALWMKAKLKCEDAQPANLNLVASNLGIARLPHNDPALVELRRAVEEETGIPANLTNQIIEALQGADHLGSLLKVDTALDEAISQYEKDLGWENNTMQLKMFPDGKIEQERLPFGKERVKANLLSEIESFLEKHSSGSDLGLRLRGEELVAGVRFLRLNREEAYDLVVANPPYQGTTKLVNSSYVQTEFKIGKADLYAAFMLRSFQLLRSHGVSALLTMRNWMFIKQYSKLRKQLLDNYDLRAIGDFDRGAFEEILDEIVAVCVSVFAKANYESIAVAQLPTPLDDKSRDKERTQRKRAATRCQTQIVNFEPNDFRDVVNWPLVYWWTTDELKDYLGREKVGEAAPVRIGMKTSNNARYVRLAFEVAKSDIELREFDDVTPTSKWVPYVQGAKGLAWFDVLREVVLWQQKGLEIKQSLFKSYGSEPQCESRYFTRGIACSTIGSRFSARLHRYRSIFSTGGTSVFPANNANELLCTLNAADSRRIVFDLNPSVNCEVGDINRIPLRDWANAESVVSTLRAAFRDHESHREPSVEFRLPGPSYWKSAQAWAQSIVDGSPSDALPQFEKKFEEESPTDHMSFAIGVALGRFTATGEGTVNPDHYDMTSALPSGILFLDGTLTSEHSDSLGLNASKNIHETWKKYAPEIGFEGSLRDWLRTKFFSDVHLGMYENRPIYWPLSSENGTFVAFVSIHRMTGQTLNLVLADYLLPTLTRLDGELNDLQDARRSSEEAASRDAENRYAEVKEWRDELNKFVFAVQHCADKGPPPISTKNKERETDAKFDPTLDDGVVVNSAALWPILEAQWDGPKIWWKQLCVAKGRKDFDWSQLAMKYWPSRVEEKCKSDPSLCVAHRRFWKYHPRLAWKWELRFQNEVRSDFRIQEDPEGSDGCVFHRESLLLNEPEFALETVEKEILRRLRKATQPIKGMALIENGIWSASPQECWDLESKIIKKQEAAFQLSAPDEKVARKELLKAKPELKKKRNELLDKYATLFAEVPDEEVTA